MSYVLSFLLSWLSGCLVILISAFFAYDHFSLIDITIFAIFTFLGFLILFLLIYILLLSIAVKKISAKPFLSYPMLFAVPANLPAYFLIWGNTPRLYGQAEATLFTLGFTTMGLIFGTWWAWRNKTQGKMLTVQRLRENAKKS
ncbi:MAG TPA: hypothetical protein VFP97_13120 [Chitinophagaceae bacterium]|nr:hypothetical protein [Chitinophagaceae bacterium]